MEVWMENVEQRWEQWEKQLFPAKGLAGGGQAEVAHTALSRSQLFELECHAEGTKARGEGG